MTHYVILGVSENATPEEIKKAYRKLASQHHPDKGGDTARFQEIQVAYDTLIDPDRRNHYDAQRQGGGQFEFRNHSGMPGFAEIFRNFGFNFGGQDPFDQFRNQQQPRRNRDIRIDMHVSLSSTLVEQTKTININTSTGHTETVEVKIPRGITNQSIMKYPKLGDNFFASLPRGDLYINLVVQVPPGFQINGLDVLTEVNIDCFTAILGGVVPVTGVDDRKFEMSIPAGTQPGTGMRLKDQGLWQMNSSTRGNLIVKINIAIPRNLNEQQLSLIRQLKNGS
jgi:DnaJ-class molecular chaperone